MPEGLTFDVVNFLNHTGLEPTVEYEPATGDYFATRDLGPEDEITINYTGYNDAGLNLFYDDLSAEERAAVSSRWRQRFRPHEEDGSGTCLLPGAHAPPPAAPFPQTIAQQIPRDEQRGSASTSAQLGPAHGGTSYTIGSWRMSKGSSKNLFLHCWS